MPAKITASPALDEALATAAASRAKIDDAIDELKGRAERVAQETLDNLRTHARPYMDDYGHRLVSAERYLVDRVQKQPITTSLAVLGVGVLLGLVLAGGRR